MEIVWEDVEKDIVKELELQAILAIKLRIRQYVLASSKTDDWRSSDFYEGYVEGILRALKVVSCQGRSKQRLEKLARRVLRGEIEETLRYYHNGLVSYDDDEVDLMEEILFYLVTGRVEDW